VRIKGSIEQLAPAISTEYFQSRSKGSQVGTWASPQSQVIQSREILDEKVRQIENRFSGLEKLPLPRSWGGYLVKPDVIEFWQR
jgi:pyridoxamine 5'-phosphate oxidase